jgi:hypothetical protein
VLILFGFVLGYFYGHRGVNELRKEITNLTKERDTLLACDDGTSVVEEIRDLLVDGRFDLASSQAEITLLRHTSPLCPEAKDNVAGWWYQASIDALFQTPRPECAESVHERQIVDIWIEIERKASKYNVPLEKRLPSMSIADRAYNARIWSLADEAFRKAYSEGAAKNKASWRHAVLRNWGKNLSDCRIGQPDSEAIKLLATARDIAAAYGLPTNIACQDLADLGYPDCTVPEPLSNEPLLKGGVYR